MSKKKVYYAVRWKDKSNWRGFVESAIEYETLEKAKEYLSEGEWIVKVEETVIE